MYVSFKPFASDVKKSTTLAMEPTMDSLKDVPEEVLVAELQQRATYVAVSDDDLIPVAVIVADLNGKIKNLECTIRNKDALIKSHLDIIRSKNALIESLDKDIAKEKVKFVQNHAEAQEDRSITCARRY